MVEKKQYPSQLNSKTISARIPVQDYVNFLNESIKLGISMNDFLLTKIYSNNKVGSLNNTEHKLSAELLNFINGYDFEICQLKEVDNVQEFWKDHNIDSNVIATESIEEYWSDSELYNNPTPTDKVLRVVYFSQRFYSVKDLLDAIYGRDSHIKRITAAKKTADLLDVKNQLTILIQDKFENIKDRNSFRKELYSLLKELE
jgi:hypothetical protein